MQYKLPNGKWVETVVVIDSAGTPAGSAQTNVLTNDQLRASPIPVSLSSGDVTINGPITVSNEVEIKNDSGNPIPVRVTPVGAISGNNVTAAVTSVITALVTANSSRRSIRFTNIGTSDVAVGFIGLTWATRCIVLRAGDMWIETDAANLAWYGICDAATTTTIAIQEIVV